MALILSMSKLYRRLYFFASSRGSFVLASKLFRSFFDFFVRRSTLSSSLFSASLSGDEFEESEFDVESSLELSELADRVSSFAAILS